MQLSNATASPAQSAAGTPLKIEVSSVRLGDLDANNASFHTNIDPDVKFMVITKHVGIEDFTNGNTFSIYFTDENGSVMLQAPFECRVENGSETVPVPDIARGAWFSWSHKTKADWMFITNPLLIKQ